MGVELVKDEITLGVFKEQILKSLEIFETIKIEDNMSNIEEVLLFSSDICITQILKKSDHYIAKGEVIISICYMGENDKIFPLKETFSFSCDLGSYEKDYCIFHITPTITKSSYEIIKKRRVETTLDISLECNYIENKPNLFINSDNCNLPLETQKEKEHYCNFDTIISSQDYIFKKDIPLYDDIRILNTCANLRNVSTNASNVGILYNANLVIDILYEINKEDESEYKVLSATYPINHFIEKSPNMKCDYYDIDCVINEILCSYYYDSENSYIEINLNLVSNTFISCDNETEIIKDAYSLEPIKTPIIENCKATYICDPFDTSIKLTQKIKSPNNENYGGVIGGSQLITYSIDTSLEQPIVSGDVLCNVMCFIDSEKIITGEVIKLSFNTQLDLDLLDNQSVFLKCYIEDISYETEKNEMIVKVSLGIKGHKISNKVLSQVVDIKQGEESLDTNQNNSYIKVYYKDKNESLWEIGKKNHLCVDSILKNNNIDAESDIRHNQPLILK